MTILTITENIFQPSGYTNIKEEKNKINNYWKNL